MSIVDVDKRRAKSKRITKRLSLLFAIAYISTVSTLILSFYCVFLIVAAPIKYFFLQYKASLDVLDTLEIEEYGQAFVSRLDFWFPNVLLGLTVCIVAMVCFTAIAKFRALKRRGGAAVAYSLGATEILDGDTNPGFLVVSNVVDEMAIAAGVPSPRIFVLEQESGINAFASGFTIQTSAICVTQGCLEKLNRSELQAVVAHEFGHILNGDTGFNSWLYIFLNSLLVVYIGIRKFVSRRLNKSEIDSNEGSMFFLTTFLALILNVFAQVSGYVGLLFSRLIQAAVARQSEFLADVAAVRLTRNPRSLCSVLWKISKLEGGLQMLAPQAEAVCHMFFCSSLDDDSKLFATHPPIVARIRAIVSYFPEAKDMGE
ncbi:MAG: M48 family metalloprotease [Synechococcus sp.]